ncbi:MAG: alkane 1-monooxygenase [Bacteroidota bacterium]
MLKDAKYLIAYLLPISGLLGILWGGGWSFGSIYVGFGLLPLVELFTPAKGENHHPEEEAERSQSWFFDVLLYANLPILYAILGYGLYVATTQTLTGLETAGLICNLGLLVGTMGINVGHELGHRTKRWEQRIAQALLLTGLYTHFFIEHNRGHHKNVSTPLDPATSRLGESIYAFWLRSTVFSYLGAWKLENSRLRKMGLPLLSWRNLMVRFTVLELAYLGVIYLCFDWYGLLLAVGIAIFGFLMLESVNYIEHYGLMRKRLPSGRYEPVSPRHSWNSDHEMGRIFLYELTRHSDHHFKATRKYQVLRRFEESPQLPAGYPGSILLSLVPPLWFRVMNERVRGYMATPSLAVEKRGLDM